MDARLIGFYGLTFSRLAPQNGVDHKISDQRFQFGRATVDFLPKRLFERIDAEGFWVDGLMTAKHIFSWGIPRPVMTCTVLR